MLLTRLLNACHHFPGFVYAGARLREAIKTIEIDVRPRQGSKARCSQCHAPASGYDQMPQRGFEFIPIWGFAVVLLYCMRRVDCRRCGVKVEEVPWGSGKHQLTKAYMLYLAHWARKLSWKETARSFHTSWEKVHQAVTYVVQWGLARRQMGPIRAIGVQRRKGPGSGQGRVIWTYMVLRRLKTYMAFHATRPDPMLGQGCCGNSDRTR